jgi:hypothetical protein
MFLLIRFARYIVGKPSSTNPYYYSNFNYNSALSISFCVGHLGGHLILTACSKSYPLCRSFVFASLPIIFYCQVIMYNRENIVFKIIINKKYTNIKKLIFIKKKH